MDSCVFLIFTTRVDQTNGSTLVKLILFEKSRVELELLVTTVTEVSPPFLGVPQIWRSRSGYKSIAVSFCDQLVCSRLLATQTRTSARDPVSSARGVRSELAEGGTSAPLGRRGGFPAVTNRRVSTVFRPYPRVCRAENCISAPQLGRELHSRPKNWLVRLSLR